MDVAAAVRAHVAGHPQIRPPSSACRRRGETLTLALVGADEEEMGKVRNDLGFPIGSAVRSFLIDRDARWTVRSSRTARIALFRTLASAWADGPKAQRPPAAGPVTRRACGAERKRPWAASAGCALRTRGTQRNGPWAETEKLWYGPHVLIRVFPLFFYFSRSCF